MTVTANIHRATHMTAQEASGSAWLSIFTKGSTASSAAIFMPFAQAVAVAAAFNSYNDAKVQEAAE
jgi:hypothetical protein